MKPVVKKSAEVRAMQKISRDRALIGVSERANASDIKFEDLGGCVFNWTWGDVSGRIEVKNKSTKLIFDL